MIEKVNVIKILENLQRCLNNKTNGQEYTLNSIKQYKKNLMIADN